MFDKLIIDKMSVFIRSGTQDDYQIKGTKIPAEALEASEYDVILDIGSHAGGIPLRIHDKCAKVICYEPFPMNFESLTKNCEDMPNVILEPLCVSNTSTTTLQFFAPKQRKGKKLGTGTGSLRKVRGREAITVHNIRIDEAIIKHSPNKLKLDCEGCEYGVMEWLIDNSDMLEDINRIVCEVHVSFNTHENVTRFLKINKRMQELGFIGEIPKILHNPKQVDGKYMFHWAAVYGNEPLVVWHR